MADVDERAGKEAADAVGGMFVQTDVTSDDDVRQLYEAAHGRYGRIDIAFNNAGISPPDDDSILDHRAGRLAPGPGGQPHLRVPVLQARDPATCSAQGKGSIINTASFVAVMGAATSQISYTASKGGVLAMTRELGVQFAREGIRVNALCPGPVNTPLLQELFAKDPERAARRLVHMPMGRFAEADEIAAAVRVPGQRRRLVHHGVDVPGRRRHLRRLRDAAVTFVNTVTAAAGYRAQHLR